MLLECSKSIELFRQIRVNDSNVLGFIRVRRIAKFDAFANPVEVKPKDMLSDEEVIAFTCLYIFI